MLFRRESINEDVTPGAPAMFSFSSHWMLSGAPDSGPPVRDPILEALTMDLGGATGTGKAGCLLSYACFASGESYVALGRGLFSGCSSHILPTGNQSEQDWSCDFRKAGQDYPRRITLSV